MNKWRQAAAHKRESILRGEKPFCQRNQTDTAKRKLTRLAEATGLDVEFVTALANFTWDYDPYFWNEGHGWVDKDVVGREAEDQLDWLADYLGLSRDFNVSPCVALGKGRTPGANTLGVLC